MKQYLNEQQTAKLIELGFEKPKSISGYYQRGPYEYDAETNTKMVVYDDTQYPIYAYSIGELIEILEEVASVVISYSYQKNGYYVRVIIPKRKGDGMYRISRIELIDVLYDMIVKLKEEGVI